MQNIFLTILFEVAKTKLQTPKMGCQEYKVVRKYTEGIGHHFVGVLSPLGPYWVAMA